MTSNTGPVYVPMDLWSRGEETIKISSYNSMVSAVKGMETASSPFISPIPLHSRGITGVGGIDSTLNSRSVV